MKILITITSFLLFLSPNTRSEETLFIISDIDDTIKITHVGNLEMVIKGLQSNHPFIGFSELYRRWRCHNLKLNKKTKSIISIFAGRMADKGKDPLPIFKRSISLTKKSKNIEILWASTREAYNYTQAKQINCNIITMPPKVIKQINGFGKSFKSMTLDTVNGFLIDSKKSKFSL